MAHIRIRVPDAHARHGAAWPGAAGLGAAWQGTARQGKAWLGRAGQGTTKGGDMFPIKGDRPQWQTVYEHLGTMKIGDVLKDDELLGLLPDAPQASVRGAFFRAVAEMEREHRRTFARVRLVGYRMVEAAEHERLARDQHKRAKRRLRSARAKISSADRTLLTDEQRRRFAAIEDHLARQASMIRRLEDRQDATEQRMSRAEKDSAMQADRVDAVLALLARHGITD